MKPNYSELLNSVIPGGAHTYSRGDDQYPSNAPSILTKGEGAYVWDADGNKYLDYGMALRAVTVGYANKPIAQAAIEEIWKGNNLTRASLTELRAAEALIDLIPSAEMVKFAKNGSTVTTAAVKIARAFTGKKFAAICAEQPFFSYDDWFISTTPMEKGIPTEGKINTLRFHYNDIASLQKLFDQYPKDIACVMLEPATSVSPCLQQCKNSFKIDGCNGCLEKNNNFLHQVQVLCKKYNTVFILDEMITGFRWHLNGAQKYFDIIPDLSTFGKGMANGFSVAALTGKKEIMEMGGIKKEGAERTFLISTTHGAEMSGLGALIKTIEIYKQQDVVSHLWKYGQQLIDGVNSIAKEEGVGDYFEMSGYPCSPVYTTRDANWEVSLAFRTLFAQELIKAKILIPWVALSCAHGDVELSTTLEAVRKAVRIYAKAIDEGVDKYLTGPHLKPVFRKFN